jgi:DNA topoisomerase-1
VKRCQELLGQELFQYLDEEKILRIIGSDDVNTYLQEIAGQKFTAKDFRTWGGTVIATRVLQELELASSETQAKRRNAHSRHDVLPGHTLCTLLPHSRRR